MEPHKRQHLLLEAMQHVKTPVRLRLCGTGSGADYVAKLQHLITSHGLGSRVVLEDRWISEDEKAERVGQALAVAYIPADEDSYGYPSLEGAHAEKPILTTSDAGGVLELVQDGINGFVVPPDPRALAEAMDRLYIDRTLARHMGLAAHQRIGELKITWSAVVDAMTQ
jgi:glycosyltransferase involved in cell wall biosynthesis